MHIIFSGWVKIPPEYETLSPMIWEGRDPPCSADTGKRGNTEVKNNLDDIVLSIKVIW